MTVAAFERHNPPFEGHVSTTKELRRCACRGGEFTLGKRLKQYGRYVVAAGLTCLCLSAPVKQLVSLPERVSLQQGQHITFDLKVPGKMAVRSSDARIVEAEPIRGRKAESVSVFSRNVGEATVSTKLFGLLPWKAVRVNVVPRREVVVGGQSIGVILHSNGLIVIGYQRIGANNTSPAADAHIEIGDVVERVNGAPVRDVNGLRRSVDAGKGPVILKLRHGQVEHNVQVQPFRDAQGHRHLGMFVREHTSGVGTMTFYDPQTKRFGALGHLISDADTGQPIEGQGPVYASEVTGVMKGTPGKPGEKHGRFLRAGGEIGEIEENTPYGVFGTMSRAPVGNSERLPVASPQQVHRGDAEILTVLNGQRIQPFHVEIENLVKQDHPSTKSMIIHVVDRRLLEKAGGIVQGMSGSPIVQDGRLVGAVTHVFVSDPTRGYGVYAAWMLDACNHPDAEDAWVNLNIPAIVPKYFTANHTGSV